MKGLKIKEKENGTGLRKEKENKRSNEINRRKNQEKGTREKGVMRIKKK